MDTTLEVNGHPCTVVARVTPGKQDLKSDTLKIKSSLLQFDSSSITIYYKGFVSRIIMNNTQKTTIEI